jgi:hypothetical protein
MNAKQARLTANGFSHRRKELEKLLPKLEKSWSELPEENPKMGSRCLGGFGLFVRKKSPGKARESCSDGFHRSELCPYFH